MSFNTSTLEVKAMLRDIDKGLNKQSSYFMDWKFSIKTAIPPKVISIVNTIPIKSQDTFGRNR